MFLAYNSDILPEAEFRLPATDRAFQYGDGLFETIRYENGHLWFWSDHVERLSAGMAALHLIPPAPIAPDLLQQTIRQLLSVNTLTDQCARVKMQVWRRTGGLYTPTDNQANVLITTRPGQPFAVTERSTVGIYDGVRLTASPLSGFKTLNALPYVLAGLAKQAGGFDDVVLLDGAGHVAECIASNLFWYQDATLYTPALTTGCVNGIARRQLLRSAPALGLPVEEVLAKPDALRRADLVFCVNAIGVQWFRQVGDWAVEGNSPLALDKEQRFGLLFGQFQR